MQGCVMNEHHLLCVCATALHDGLSAFASQKVFVCVTTVLTWARSKPLDPVSRIRLHLLDSLLFAFLIHSMYGFHTCVSFKRG